MSGIKILSSNVADKIAAGEVAERPSAVVKELVENAIDAGADKITVEIKNGGITYIRVADNGKGILSDEVEIAFLRHSTSKLREVEDLYQIATMGFRGEALASICAVAEVEVITRTASEPEGTFMKISHGKAMPKEYIACNEGTTMVIKELFANVPARMKFLKRDSTEAGYVSDLVGRIALSHPHIAFKYICDGKEIFSTLGDNEVKNVVLRIYGIDFAKSLIDVDYKEDGLGISGVIGKPEISRGNRSKQTLFVNKRYIKNHIAAKVIEDAYKNTVMVGKFPFFVINISISPELVDVNVHPAKTEVKFANEKRVYEILFHAVKNALYSRESVPEIGPKDTKSSFEFKKENNSAMQFKVNIPGIEKQTVNKKIVNEFLEYTKPKLLEDTYITEKGEKVRQVFRESTAGDEIFQEVNTQELVIEGEQDNTDQNYKIVGQIFDTYIIIEQNSEIFLIDQHAAHERLRFEELIKDYREDRSFSQVLLMPVVMELSMLEMQIVLDNLFAFSKFGFEIEEFGNNAIIIRRTPITTDDDTIKSLVGEIIDIFDQNRKHNILQIEEKTLDTIACKYAIKANKKLSQIEMDDLIRRLYELNRKGINTCPHGRPIKISMTKHSIEKMFKRIV